ncbi:MAG: hypothetical protein KAS32_07785 [Candidatus Peribacteraceae bacterium]|nr:hypothetical protein [Candidatus Peribacteraceae bacterium]
MNCDVCGEDLRDENGSVWAGKQISLLGAHPARKRVEEVFGKNKFYICYVCVLKSLGVKRKIENEEKRKN